MHSRGHRGQGRFRPLQDWFQTCVIDILLLLPLPSPLTWDIVFYTVRKEGEEAAVEFVKCKEKIQSVCCHGDDNDVVVLLLSEGGKVFCVNTQTYNSKPLEALCNIPVSQVACGSQHSVALTKGGQVYTWGRNSRGQLGLGRSETSTNSQRLGGLSALPLVRVAAGGEHSFILCVSGAVFGWGRNDRRKLGLGDTADRHTATAVHCLNKKSTIYISRGKDHTAILSKNGAVFTFGSSQYGQLRHNSFSDELRPRLAVELLGAKVTKIACGWHHTLVLTRSKRVYSFGCGEQGQLGHGKESHPSVPLPVQLLQDATDARIENIFAGGNCSFATCMPTQVNEETNAVGIKTQHCLNDMIDKWTLGYNSKTWKKIKQKCRHREIHRTFSSASFLKTIFLEQIKDKHFQTSPKYSGLNLSVARLTFEKLVKQDNVFAEVEASLLHLLPSLDKKPTPPSGVEGLRIYLLLNELLHVIQRHKHNGSSTTLAEAVTASRLNLSADGLPVIATTVTHHPSIVHDDPLKEFVDAYVNHAFNTSVDGVFQEFRQGFFQVCDQDLVKLFRPKELQEVLVGKNFHDWAKLKQNTGNKGVYNTTPPHPTIQIFWEVFDELTEDQRRAFLWFVTGSERVPILGLDKIKMKVIPKEVEDLCSDEDYPQFIFHGFNFILFYNFL
ncbi:LOW QUALITY PROTEIN: putative E3 ubiquitin-protein ligase HERC3 [Spinachia spinachia]